MLETLLLNFLFLLIPVLIFLIFFEHRPHSNNKFVLVLLSAVTMILCITMPIKIKLGFIIDLRYIPFIIVALYGGYKAVWPLYILLNLYRFYVGGEGTFQSFLFSTIIFILIPLFNRRFIKLSSKKRVLFAGFVCSLIACIYLTSLSTFFNSLNSEFWYVGLLTFITNVGAMLIIMILIEQIIANIKNREQFVHSERLNVVSELSASVSHEIRNPLTVTSGFLQLLKQSTTITNEEKRYIELSLQELHRAEKIVSDYLSFAKPQSENMVYSNLFTETEYTKDLIIPFATMHQVEVQFHFTNTLFTRYDRNQIQQCLINLYKNGIEAMKETGGGTLTIDISEKKQKILIKIQDTGIGMTRDQISHLGQPYYSTKEKGTGLGMLMVYSTINKLKGSIDIESRKGKGTTFLITIPVLEA
ncbi:ATP-binding protein [Heyndrickxia oleronia]|uniref:ATP-binding protein n=1 Tax=Heyndrickxia oleronia TaxID=38875 RepID=UPI003F83582B